MREQRLIVDTTLRDGEQSPGVAMTISQKVKIAKLLDNIGIYQIEAGIPAIGNYEIETIQEISRNKNNALISVWARLTEEDIRLSMLCNPDIIHISIPVSYALIYTKLNKNKTWILKNLVSCVEYAKTAGCEITIGFEDASRADITFMACIAEKLREMGVNRIRYADTVGVLTPSKAYGAVRDLISYTGIEVEIHTHNDLGMAVANAIEASKAGAKYIDTTIFGIGERAGNCHFQNFVNAGEKLFSLGISTFKALEVGEEFLQILENRIVI